MKQTGKQPAGGSAGFGFVRLTCAIPETAPGDCFGNTGHMIRMLSGIMEHKSQVVVFPELCITGYTCGDLFYQNRLLDAAHEAYRRLLEASREVPAVIACGLPVWKDGRLYNCGVLSCKGEIFGAVPKSYLPNHQEFYEKRWFTPGKGTSGTVVLLGREIPFGDDLLFKTHIRSGFGGEIRIGVEICEDLWMPVPPSSLQALAGAGILLNLGASNATVGKHAYRRELVRQQSARCIAAYVYASAAEGESTTDTVFSGAAVIAENGRELVFSSGIETGNRLWTVDADLDWLSSDRLRSEGFTAAGQEANNGSGARHYRMVDIPMPLHEGNGLMRTVTAFPFVPENRRERDERCEEILSIQTAGLVKRIRYSGARKLAVNVSGGLDSTLALLVCIRAGKKLDRPMHDIVALSLPCYGTTARTMGNAQRLCTRLGCDFREIDIKEACDLHLRDIGHCGEPEGAAYENTQARERTQLLFDLSNHEGALAVGTGDLSEMALGWCTYGGDQMAMYNVNAGVPKTLVRYLIEWISGQEDMAEVKEILKDILETPVSPELLPPDRTGSIAQKTEEIIGPYELHDFFLYHTIRYGAPPRKVIFLARTAFGDRYASGEIARWARLFYRRFFASQFKRSCTPDGPKIGSISLSPRTDWRMPSDACPDLWLDPGEFEDSGNGC